MRGRLQRAWRRWQAWRLRQAKLRLFAPLGYSPPGQFYSSELLFPELRPVLKAGGPELQPYEGLAAFWDEYASYRPDYPAFLKFLVGYKIWGWTILDLACGTGGMTARLAHAGARVVGLDASENMLGIARERCGRLRRVSFTRGDFRNFNIGRQFDAVVCAFNSLNYVADGDELGRAFAAVAIHLRPGGVFVFDVTTEWGMRHGWNNCFHAQLTDRRFAILFEYDRTERRETSRAILPSGVETHRRIPLGLSDVTRAASEAGLVMEDCFSGQLATSSEPSECGTLYFVLRKKAISS